MSQGDFFSGLVQGLGGSIAQMHQQKSERDYQDKMTRLNILMSASKDPNMLNSVRREVLRQGLSEFGPKYAGLADTIVQDHDVQTGRQLAQSDEVDIPNVPTRPANIQGIGSQPETGEPTVTDNGGQAPPINMKGVSPITRRALSRGSTGGDANFSQPTDQGQISSGPFSGNLGLPTMEGSAPVTRAATGGMAANPTQAEIGVEQARKMLRIMPPRPEILRSDSLSPAQEEQYRQEQSMRTGAGIQQSVAQSGKLWEMQNIQIPMMRLESQIHDESLRKEILAHLSAIPAQQQAEILGKLSSTRQALGRELTPDEMRQTLGFSLTPGEVDSQRRAQLEKDLTSSDPATRSAAQRELTMQQAQLQATQANTLGDVARTNQLLSEGSPAQQSRQAAQYAVEAKRRANVVFKNPDLIRQRAKAIQYQLDQDDPIGKVTGTHGKAALEQANKEIESVRQNVESQIGLALQAGKQPILYSEALKEYMSHPNPKGLTFQQVLDSIEGNDGVVLIDDGTAKDQPTSKGASVKGKPKSKFIPGQVTPSH